MALPVLHLVAGQLGPRVDPRAHPLLGPQGHLFGDGEEARAPALAAELRLDLGDAEREGIEVHAHRAVARDHRFDGHRSAPHEGVDDRLLRRGERRDRAPRDAGVHLRRIGVKAVGQLVTVDVGHVQESLREERGGLVVSLHEDLAAHVRERLASRVLHGEGASASLTGRPKKRLSSWAAGVRSPPSPRATRGALCSKEPSWSSSRANV